MAGNGLIATCKFVAGALTGSASMISEAVHSVADTANQGLLLLGMGRAKRPATEEHPFGFGVESYFWPFVVSIVIFLLGGVFAIYEGVHGLMEPPSHADEGSLIWNYVVLGAAIVFEGTVFAVAIKEFRVLRGQRGNVEVFLGTKDPTIPVVLMEDFAALVGLIIALIAIGMSQWTGWYGWDAIGSLCIGVLLCGVALLLGRETYSLLLGESAPKYVRTSVRALVEADASAERVTQLLSLHRGGNDVILAMKVKFGREHDLAQLELAIDRIEKAIRDAHPQMTRIFIEPDGDFDGTDSRVS